MLVTSQRFGPLEIPENKIITLVRPVLGFERLSRFCLVERTEFWPFIWLQSLEEPAIAFIIVNPAVFYEDYRIEINPKEIAELETTRLEAVESYVIVTIPDDPRKMSLNLQGPILINVDNNRGKQLVLVNSEYRVNHYTLEEIDQATPAEEKAEEFAAI